MSIHLSLIIIHSLYFYIMQCLIAQSFIYKNNGKSWLSVLFVEIITFYLSYYLELEINIKWMIITY